MKHLGLIAALLASHLAAADLTASPVSIASFPDETLVDQDGKSVKLMSDLLKQKPAIINFIFTRCTTICSPLSATMAALQRQVLEKPAAEQPALVSISLDPEHDTPARLKAFSEKFNRKPGWTLLTGDSATVERVLAALGGAVARKEAHSPQWLVGDASRNQWKRVVGLSVGPTDLLSLVPKAAGASTEKRSPSQEAADAAYFTNTELVDHTGRKIRFYEDLVKGKTVIVNFGFTSCKGACSPISQNLAKVQNLLGDKLESSIRIVTLTVDPKFDTPEKLKAYAARFKSKPGWYFVTGPADNVNLVLKKLGGLTKTPDEHPTTLFIGDARTSIWTKANAGESPETIAFAAEHVGDPK